MLDEQPLVFQRADRYVLQIGVNDIYAPTYKGGVEERLARIATRLPDKPMVWSGLLPSTSPGVRDTDTIAANHAIEVLCKARKHCRYLDPATVLSDAHGNLISGVMTSDGIHLTEAGYLLWRRGLETSGQVAAIDNEGRPSDPMGAR